MNIGNLARRTERLVTDNAPLILTALGVVGAVGTAVLTGRATFKAAEIIRYDSSTETVGRITPTREKILLVWKLYMPAAGVLTLTCASIIMAQKINTRRAAVLLAGAAFYRDELTEYKDKIQEQVGGKKVHKEAKKAAVDERVNSVDYTAMVIETGYGKTLFLDSYTLRPFRSSIEHVKRTEVNMQSRCLREGYVSLAEWYDENKLEHTALSEELGWDTDENIVVEHVPSLIKEGPLEGEPCIYLAYEPWPKLRPWKSRD